MKLKILFGFFVLFNNANVFSESTWETLKQLMREKNLALFSKTLDKHPELLNGQDKSGMTLLMLACANNRPLLARYLLAKGADKELENEFPGSRRALDLSRLYCNSIVYLLESRD